MMAYGITVGGESQGYRKMPKKRKKKKGPAGGGSMEMQSMLKKYYGKGSAPKIILGQ
jgi:hypothetical protein